MVKNKFELSFASELESVGRIMQDILQFIDKAFPLLPVEEKTDIRLIFSELLCNAVIHGNKSDCGKKVYLLIEVYESAIHSKIADEGAGFDYRKIITGVPDDLILQSENGRGIKLVYSLTDDFSWNIPGNEIFFNKRVTLHGQNINS